MTGFRLSPLGKRIFLARPQSDVTLVLTAAHECGHALCAYASGWGPSVLELVPGTGGSCYGNPPSTATDGDKAFFWGGGLAGSLALLEGFEVTWTGSDRVKADAIALGHRFGQRWLGDKLTAAIGFVEHNPHLMESLILALLAAPNLVLDVPEVGALIVGTPRP